ncbi:MAG: nucleoside deaminase [Brachybacterium tyrofermentans]|uniref:Nucleoside deaminase n=1 Tax=Brachybacterium tyrofermentans TaxID=47848 RepID=A0ABW0FHH5_9MICO|nr:nucleoside deaminase [Brachybacterium tyrofermentans]SLN04644.1 tRNA-specific adenosine-34 deaminase [Corynebacterium xerosis]
MSTAAENDHLDRAIDLAAANVAEGGGPFGAVLLTADGRGFDGVNRVTADHDPTAHAEVLAIRAACTELGTHELPGAVLYASCEPCPMCLASALWARIDTVVFAADREDAAQAGFDDAAFYGYFDTPGSDDLLRTEQHRRAGAAAPFTAWRDHEDRAEY